MKTTHGSVAVKKKSAVAGQRDGTAGWETSVEGDTLLLRCTCQSQRLQTKQLQFTTTLHNSAHHIHPSHSLTLLATMTVTIPSVKYACNGEAAREFEIPAYKTYNLKPTHDIFQHGEVSELSHLIGMPLVIQQLRPSLLQVFRTVRSGPGGRHPEMAGGGNVKGKGGHERDGEVKTAYASYDSKDGADYFPNDTAAHLMIVCSSTTTAPLFCPPAKWTDKVGSVLIARHDMVPLHPMHIEILKSFIAAVHEVLTEESQGQGFTAEAIAEKLTPGMWRAYWTMATEHMNKTGQNKQLEGVPAPFVVDDDGPITTKASRRGADEGGVHVGGDPDMMDCSDIGFTQ